MRLRYLILIVLSVGTFLFALVAPRWFSVSWFVQAVLIVVAIAFGIHQVRLGDEIEKERALRHMAGRQPLSHTEFGQSFFGPDSADIAARLRSIMARHIEVDLSRLHPDDRVVEDIRMDALDSMSTVEFVLEIEKEFHICVPDAAAEKMRTLRDVIEYVSQETRKAAV